MTAMLETLLERTILEVVRDAVDVEKLAWIEHELVESLSDDGAERDEASRVVALYFEAAWQTLHETLTRFREADCPICEALGTPG